MLLKKNHFNDYIKCSENVTADKSDYILHKTQLCIKSKLFYVYSMEQTNIALNPYGVKRYLVPKAHKLLTLFCFLSVDDFLIFVHKENRLIDYHCLQFHPLYHSSNADANNKYILGEF